ncbi:MAG: hypothetical protein A2219_01510 [Elusimicrobia bacterium RIFOXYA2_FULL_50_26]|nr:MAG: hypothetical protein A2219_01510 [Elusimicrobia bacterium RIFOXYA2_FULL_50_26]OGS23345.1 MAG: hypothetical protein A2314_04975 [Elusimicrobia bacterium RIFOXYB2_FULL_50_12]
MKIDFTPREVELLLMLINDIADGDFTFKESAVYSIEELSIIGKLEAALRQNISLKEFAETINSSDLKH